MCLWQETSTQVDKSHFGVRSGSWGRRGTVDFGSEIETLPDTTYMGTGYQHTGTCTETKLESDGPLTPPLFSLSRRGVRRRLGWLALSRLFVFPPSGDGVLGVGYRARHQGGQESGGCGPRQHPPEPRQEVRTEEKNKKTNKNTTRSVSSLPLILHAPANTSAQKHVGVERCAKKMPNNFTCLGACRPGVC